MLCRSSRPLTKKQKKRAAAEAAKVAAKVKASMAKGKKATKPNVWKRAVSEDNDDVVLDEGEVRRRQQRDRRFHSPAQSAARAAAAAAAPKFDVMVRSSAAYDISWQHACPCSCL